MLCQIKNSFFMQYFVQLVSFLIFFFSLITLFSHNEILPLMVFIIAHCNGFDGFPFEKR